MKKNDTWWKEATIYQIWPASYKDSNGDGFGDINGIISTLDYLKNLGVDIIWISPMYESPQKDMGYDISDYQNMDPKYGSMEDMDRLIAAVHCRGMKLVMDLVINHTSTMHKWFLESRSSKTNPKRDWYIWKSPKFDPEGKLCPPNNWSTYFFESVWEYDDLTEEYFFHLFSKTQADLNWENKEVREAINKEAIEYWLKKGIDGFRLDVAGMYSKVQTLEDAPILFPDQKWQPCRQFHESGPRIHEFHREMYEKLFSKYDVMTVGEVGYSKKEDSLKYVSAAAKEMNMMFLFDVVDLGVDPLYRYEFLGWNLQDMKEKIANMSSFAEGTDAWSTCFIENHDQARAISRFGDDRPEHLFKSGKMLATMLLCLSGTLFIYQGQEIGMTNVPKEWGIEEYLDISTINYYEQCVVTQDEKNVSKVLGDLRLLARDNARTPFQWNTSLNAGFSSGKPWMRVNDNYTQINAEAQIRDENSLFHFYKRGLKLRKMYKDFFIYGELRILDIENSEVFTFLKVSNGRSVYVVLNFSCKSVKFTPLVSGSLELLLTNAAEIDHGTVSAYESRIYMVKD